MKFSCSFWFSFMWMSLKWEKHHRREQCSKPDFFIPLYAVLVFFGSLYHWLKKLYSLYNWVESVSSPISQPTRVFGKSCSLTLWEIGILVPHNLHPWLGGGGIPIQWAIPFRVIARIAPWDFSPKKISLQNPSLTKVSTSGSKILNVFRYLFFFVLLYGRDVRLVSVDTFRWSYPL